jgi:hypothetical protein
MSACGSGGGCQTKGKGLAWQRLLLDEVLPRLYPTATWGELSAAQARRLGPSPTLRREAARRVGAAIDRQPLLWSGDADDLCDHLWLPRRRGQSCVLPGLLQQDPAALGRLGSGPFPGEVLEEQYLCISLSTVAPLAQGRQVLLRATPDEDGSGLSVEMPPGTNIREAASKVLERTIARTLDELGISYLDWRLTESPPPDHRSGRYSELHGLDAPPLSAYLFSPQRNDIAVSVWLGPAGGVSSGVGTSASTGEGASTATSTGAGAGVDRGTGGAPSASVRPSEPSAA